MTAQEAKNKYATITDSMIDDMGKCDIAMNRLMDSMCNEYKTGLARDPKKVRQHYLNRTLEQKKKYYKYVRKNK